MTCGCNLHVATAMAFVASVVLLAGSVPPVLARSFVSIGSDDWGRWSNHGPIWPNSGTRQLFHEQGLWLSGGDPPKITAESVDDVEELFSFIESLNAGSPPTQQVVLTPFWVMAGPDYEGMRDTGCPGSACVYKELWWHNSSGGLAREPYERGDLRESYQQGLRRGIWRPQYHGRSHFDVQAWTAYLREEEEVTSIYFNNGLTYYHYGKRDEQDGLFHSTHSEYKSDHRTFQRGPQEIGQWVEKGLESFEAFWGYAASVTAMPCHYGDQLLGEVFRSHGIEMVEGEESGRGLLPNLLGMGRVMFDPAFEDEAQWQHVLHTALGHVRTRLQSERMVSVQWHAQNSLGRGADGVFDEQQRAKLRRLFGQLVGELREMDGGQAVLVTASELAQIAQRGWSVDGWPGWVRVRNYRGRELRTSAEQLLASMLPAQDGADGGAAATRARAWCIAGGRGDRAGAAEDGNELVLEDDSEYVVARVDDVDRLPDAARRLVLHRSRASSRDDSSQLQGVQEGGWVVVDDEATPPLHGGQEVLGRAPWTPAEVRERVGVRWEVEAAGAGQARVTVHVQGLEFLSAETGVRPDIGYAAMLVGHVRLATLFEPTRTISVDRSTGSWRPERRGMREAPGVAVVPGREGEVVVSVVLYHGDGTAMGLVSSVLVDLEGGRERRRQQGRAVTVHRRARLQGSAALAATEEAVGEELQCLADGAHCGLLCGWEGVVPVPCPAAAVRPSEALQAWSAAAPALPEGWDGDALALSVVVLMRGGSGEASGLRRTLAGLRAASAYPIERVVVVDCSRAPSAAKRALADMATWGAQLELVHSAGEAERADLMASLALGYARVTSPWVLVTTDEIDFTLRGSWAAEAVALLRANAKAASVALLDPEHRPHCPLLRAGKTPSNHTFFPFAASWESPWAGLTLLPSVHRREAFQLAQPLSTFPSLADLEAFLRLLGYSALSLVSHVASVREEPASGGAAAG